MTFDPDALRYRGPTRERAYALFSSLGFRTLVAGIRADGRDRPRATTRVVGIDRGGRRAGGRAARRPGAFGVAPIAAAEPRPSRADIVGWSFSTAPGSARVRADGAHSGLADHAEPRRAGGVRAASVRSWPTRSIAKVGHDLKFATIAAARARASTLAAAISTRWSRAICSTRRGRAMRSTASRSSARTTARSTEAGRHRQGREGRDARCRAGRVARDFAGERADLPLTLAPALREELEARGPDGRLPRAGAAAHSGARGHRARRHPGRHARRSRRSAATMQGELDELCRADLRTRRMRVQHQLAETARRHAVRAS